ncbi:MAG: ABC transporter ATP-binding protein [Bdellovibrio sp. CG10_big_fil_rev_8_21_14_0_10_47_8]|nr:MAG: ABC transporter ATP-binding protein [Bdellovibrio sp. CG10_big_fil_rev_8_21_14_0_10_47_8]
MGLIQIRDFQKSFGTKKVHQGVSFDVRKGECLGLIGGSGTGKSVLLRSMIGLERPDAGEVIFDGIPVHELTERQLIDVRKRMAYAFQGGALFDSMTVFDNLAYPLREHTQMTEIEISKKIKAQLAEFGLQGNEEVYPGNLSGGMQKRVGLARSIILGPEVILYDEPTAGLDPFNTRKIQDMVLRLKSTGVTAVLVTHDMPFAFAVCDRIAMLMNGRIRASGTVDEIEQQDSNLIGKFAQGEMI